MQNSERYGMHVNVAKTKTLGKNHKRIDDTKVNIDGQVIENVKSFIYLYLAVSLHGIIMTVLKTYKEELD